MVAKMTHTSLQKVARAAYQRFTRILSGMMTSMYA